MESGEQQNSRASLYVILRVNMVDAFKLDEEMMKIFRAQFVNIFRYADLGFDIEMDFKDEIDLLLHGIIFWFTIARNERTPGANLQNLQYINRLTGSTKLSGWTRFQYFFGSVLLKWLILKFTKRLRAKQAAEPNEKLEAFITWLERAEHAFKLLSFLHLCYFLRYGGPRTILERLLNMQQVLKVPQKGRVIVYEYMINRLIWESFTDFILFLFPLINFRKVWYRLKQIGNWFGLGKRPEQIAGFQRNERCPICDTDNIAIPVRASCGHVYCYYCLSATILDSKNYRCELCSELVLDYQVAKSQDYVTE